MSGPAKRSPSIKEFTPSAVQDNGRRGEPKLGCDCVQCFGYCMVDQDEAMRQQSINAMHRGMVRPSWAPIDLLLKEAA